VLGATAWWTQQERAKPSGSTDQAVLAVGEFLSKSDESTSAEAFETLVHMGLLRSEENLWVLDPQWLEHQRAKLADTSGSQNPSAIDVALAAHASHVLHGRLSFEDGVDRAECMLLDVRNGRTIAAWSESASSTRALAALVANRTLRTLLPSEASRLQKTDEVLATSNPDAWQTYIRAQRYRSEDRGDDYRRELESAVDLDSTFALAAYEYAMQSERQWPTATTRTMTELAWRHRSSLDLQRRLLIEAKRFEFEGKLQESIDILREVNRRWPEDVQTAEQLVSYLWYWGHTPEMNRVLKRSLVFFPESAELRSYNAFGLGFVGDLDRAQREFEYVLSRQTEELGADSKTAVNTLDNLIEVSLVSGARDKAAKLLARPEAEGVWFSIRRAELLMCGGRLREAVDLLRSKGADDPANPDFRAFMAQEAACFAHLLCEAGRTSEYLSLADSLNAMMNGAYFPFMFGTLFEYDRSDLIRTELDFDEGLKATRRAYPPLIARAVELAAAVEIALIDNRLKAARDSVEALTDHVHKPGVPGGWIGGVQELRTRVALAEGDGSRALDEILSLAARGHDALVWSDIGFRSLYAQALDAAGRHEEAANYLERLLENYQGRALSRLALARIQRKLGRIDSSRANYQRFLVGWSDAEPDNPTLLEARREFQELKETAD
jgi:tetratricopeptide (TPR) repeat protein